MQKLLDALGVGVEFLLIFLGLIVAFAASGALFFWLWDVVILGKLFAHSKHRDFVANIHWEAFAFGFGLLISVFAGVFLCLLPVWGLLAILKAVSPASVHWIMSFDLVSVSEDGIYLTSWAFGSGYCFCLILPMFRESLPYKVAVAEKARVEEVELDRSAQPRMKSSETLNPQIVAQALRRAHLKLGTDLGQAIPSASTTETPPQGTTLPVETPKPETGQVTPTETPNPIQVPSDVYSKWEDSIQVPPEIQAILDRTKGLRPDGTRVSDVPQPDVSPIEQTPEATRPVVESEPDIPLQEDVPPEVQAAMDGMASRRQAKASVVPKPDVSPIEQTPEATRPVVESGAEIPIQAELPPEVRAALDNQREINLREAKASEVP